MNPETKAPEAAIDIAATDTNAPAVKAPIAGGKPAVELKIQKPQRDLDPRKVPLI